MKKNIGGLLLYTWLFYEVFGPLREWLEGDGLSLFSWLNSITDFLIITTNIIAFMVYSIGAYLVLFYTYKKIHTIFSGLLIVAVVPAAIAFRYFIQELVLRWVIGTGNYTDGYPLNIYFIDNLYYAFVFVSFGVIIYFLRYSKFKESQEQQLKIENQKIQLSLLQSQVNPHFLFNALNNIYALVNEQNSQSLSALEKLSSILRYSLYEQAEFVPIQREWEKLEDLIMLESLRLAERPAILMEVPTELPPVCIPPFILIGLVENVFKHGVVTKPEAPVRIVLQLQQEQLHFKISNSIATRNKDKTGGIGLDNTARRLDLLYPDQHTFEVDQTEDQFTVQLAIPARLC